MNEIEELKKRAAKRRMLERAHRTPGEELGAWRAAEADLDRAITIAEQHEKWSKEYCTGLAVAAEQRDKAISALVEIGTGEQKAIAAALALRDQLQRGYPKGLPRGNHDKVLAETAWLEEHR